MSDTSKWLEFFESAGIPSKLSLQYARAFTNHRIQYSMLGDLSKEVLREVGVTAVGDVIAILKRARENVEEETDRETLATVKTARSDPATSTTAHRPKLTVTVPTASVSTRKRAPAGTQPPSPPAVKKQRISSAAEDRDTYSIRMPVGSTPKSRQLLQKSAAMKAQQQQSLTTDRPTRGVFSRLGVGLRSDQSIRQIRTRKFGTQKLESSPEVTSTTDEYGSLVSDRLEKKSIMSRLGDAQPAARTNFVVTLSNQPRKTKVIPTTRKNNDQGIKNRLGGRVTAQKSSGIFSRLGV